MKIWRMLKAHWCLWHDYYHTPKGGYDIRDYLRAFCIITATILFVMGIVLIVTD